MRLARRHYPGAGHVGGRGRQTAPRAAPTEVPPAISDLTATALGTTSILLEWTPAPSATSHQYRIDGGSWVNCNDNSGAQAVLFLEPDTEYDFEVRGVNVVGGGDPSNVATESTAALDTIAAPVVTLTSGAGEPPEATISNLYDSHYIRLQRTSTLGDYSSPTLDILYGPVANDDLIIGIDNAKWALVGYIDPVGVWGQRYRYERDDGAVSNWSNEISGEVTTSVATWVTTTGVNKNQYIAISGDNDEIASGSADVGAPCGVRATVEAQADTFEVTFTVLGVVNRVILGVVGTTPAIGPGVYPGPGAGGNGGAAMHLKVGNTNAERFINNSSQNRALGATPGAGDVIRMTGNKTTNAVTWYYTPNGGSEALLSSDTITVGVPDEWFAYFGAYFDGDSASADFSSYG